MQGGVLFRNIMMREDLLEFEDSSDEEARIKALQLGDKELANEQKEMEDEINYKFSSVAGSTSGSIDQPT